MHAFKNKITIFVNMKIPTLGTLEYKNKPKNKQY